MTASSSPTTEAAQLPAGRPEDFLPAPPPAPAPMPRGDSPEAVAARDAWAAERTAEGARAVEALLRVMAALRNPVGGCPWDLKQDIRSLRAGVIEEAYETLAAIEEGSLPHLREELGDLLFQVVSLARVASEDGAFDLAQVARGISEKLIRRHPHVFGDVHVDSPEGVIRNWEKLKLREPDKADRHSVMDSIDRHAPPLHRAYQLQKKAAKVGFDWSRLDEVFAKLSEEVGEFKEAVASGVRKQIVAELGDILFTVVNAARFIDCDPAFALERTNAKFERRFRVVESEIHAQGRELTDCTLPEMEAIWDRQRREEHAAEAAEAAANGSPEA